MCIYTTHTPVMILNPPIVLCVYVSMILLVFRRPDPFCDYKLDPDWLALVCNRFTSGRKPIISPVHHAD